MIDRVALIYYLLCGSGDVTWLKSMPFIILAKGEGEVSCGTAWWLCSGFNRSSVVVVLVLQDFCDDDGGGSVLDKVFLLLLFSCYRNMVVAMEVNFME